MIKKRKLLNRSGAFFMPWKNWRNCCYPCWFVYNRSGASQRLQDSGNV